MLFLLTGKCSYACPHCMVNASPDGGEATLKVINQLNRFVARVGARVIMVSGGEPTEHSKFWDYFPKILKANSKRFVGLATNGHWLRDDGFVRRLGKLQQKRNFFIQITAIPELYSNAQETTELYERQKQYFSQIDLTRHIISIDQLGRAKGKDWSHMDKHTEKGKLHQRVAPGCFNIFSASRSTPSLKQSIQALETQSKSSFCKPMVDWNGVLYPGESIECDSIGYITDPLEVLHKRLSTLLPCGNCGVKPPI